MPNMFVEMKCDFILADLCKVVAERWKLPVQAGNETYDTYFSPGMWKVYLLEDAWKVFKKSTNEQGVKDLSTT